MQKNHHNSHANLVVRRWDPTQFQILKFIIKHIDGVLVDKVSNNHFVMVLMKDQNLNHLNLQ